MTGAPPPPPPPPPGGAPPPPPPPPPGGPPPSGGPPGYGAPMGYGGAPPGPSRTNGMSIASLVLGLVGLPLCFLFVPSLLAVIFGFVGLSQIKQDPTQRGRGMAIAGIVLGLSILALVVLALVFGDTTFTIDS